jgi:CBS domain-containing protein
MSLKEICHDTVVQLRPEATVSEAARLMEQKNVGCVVVAEHGRPVGILTDRDIVLRVLNRGLDHQDLPLRDVMTREPVSFSENLSVSQAMEQLQTNVPRGRRFPVVDDRGIITGIVTIDDMIRSVGKEIHAVEGILEREAARL